MMLQTTDIQCALAKLLNHYPESGHNATSIGKLAFDWHDLLTEEGVTRKQFSAGIRHAVKTCRFFPKLADVLEGVRGYRESPPQPKSDTLQIADTTSMHDVTPEEVERNKERIQIILKALSKELTIEEAVEMVSMKSHIAEFVTDGQIQSDLRPD